MGREKGRLPLAITAFTAVVDCLRIEQDFTDSYRSPAALAVTVVSDMAAQHIFRSSPVRHNFLSLACVYLHLPTAFQVPNTAPGSQ